MSLGQIPKIIEDLFPVTRRQRVLDRVVLHTEMPQLGAFEQAGWECCEVVVADSQFDEIRQGADTLRE